MHIQALKSEFDLIKTFKLPTGTTICLTDEEGQPLQTWKLSDNQFKLEVDFIENARPFKNGEREKFLAKFDRQSIIDYFINHPKNDRKTRQAEYSALCNHEYELLKYFHHAGSYNPDNMVGNYNLSINKNSILKKVKKEFNLVLSRYKEVAPQLKEIILYISENTCSQYGYYNLIVTTKQYKITKTTYGSSKEIFKSDSLDDILNFIQKNLWANDYDR